MPQGTKKLLADALKLPRKTRAMIAETLLASLEDNDPLDAAIENAERRWEAYKAGEIKGIPIEEVFPNLATKAKQAKNA
jgi:putative addiction module component (TIGR02574 family)